MPEYCHLLLFKNDAKNRNPLTYNNYKQKTMNLINSFPLIAKVRIIDCISYNSKIKINLGSANA